MAPMASIHDVASAVSTRHPDVLADRKHDAATRCLDFPGKLNAARRGADDHHAAIGQKTRVPVLQRRETRQLAGQTGTQRWHRGDVAGPARNHQHTAAPGPLTGRDIVAFLHLPHPHHPCSRRDWSARELGIPLQKLDDLEHSHEVPDCRRHRRSPGDGTASSASKGGASSTVRSAMSSQSRRARGST